MNKTLVMVFRNSLGRLVRLSVDNVKDGITETEIKTAMDGLLAKNVFIMANGVLKEAISASIITTQTQDFDLA